MNFLIYGAGAIGGYIGGMLALSGNNVTFVARPAQAESINSRGLTVRGANGTRNTQYAKAVTSPHEAFSGNN